MLFYLHILPATGRRKPSGPKGPVIDLHWAVLPATPDCLKGDQAGAE
ncbi:MAG: hypothetical protein J0H80_15590 [Rhizobiales bacterium]|nr:hypothetical protein [Hyphomicrobiales bacterium]